MQSVKAKLQDAQKIKRELISKNVIDLKYLVCKDSKFIYFPVKGEVKGYDIVDKDFKTRKVTKNLKSSAAEFLDGEELKSLRKSMDIIGNIAILEIPYNLIPKEKIIAEQVLSKNITTVLRKGKHEGEFRIQKLKFLAGIDTRETMHKENGVVLKVDVEKVYFSPRLSNERKRIMNLIKEGEDVLIMGSGGGAYTCVISKNTPARKVIGVEINPEGHRYAQENIQLNKLKNVQNYCGDVADIVPKLGLKFDRIIMPMPKTADEFLSVAIEHAKKGATIHFYDFELEIEVDKGVEKIRKAANKADRKFKLLEAVKAGAPGPKEYRYSYDFKLD